MKQELSTGVAIAIIVAVVLIAGFLLYRSFVAGGIQGDGRAGEVQAAPPVPGGGAPPSSSR